MQHYCLHDEQIIIKIMMTIIRMTIIIIVVINNYLANRPGRTQNSRKCYRDRIYYHHYYTLQTI